MKSVMVLQVLAIIMLIATAVLFVLHFTNDISKAWSSWTLLIGVALNLIGGIIYLKTKKNK